VRDNSAAFNAFNQASSKSLRLVVKIEFDDPLYLTSHSDISGISGPGTTIDGCLRNVSSTSQRLVPDAGRSEIGSMTFSVVDLAGAVTDHFRTEQAAGNGLKYRTVRLYRGGAGMDFSAFRLEQTQIIDSSVTFDNGEYRVQCADIQREMRRDLFDLAVTRLSATLEAGATTLDVFDTSDFEACSHVASFSDEPSGSFYYLKIKYNNGFEILKATGKTATSFTGVTRGMFGTDDVKHELPDDSDTDSGVEVEEYVYLELPAPAMAHALLTGNIIGGGTLPTSWHLGISTSLVDEASFEEVGADWFDSSDYTQGLIFRFQGLKKTDGKRFIEREVCLLAGAFMLVGADGVVYLRRMTGIISSADYVAEIGVNNAIALGAVKHDLAAIRNSYDIEWSWIEVPGADPKFVRRNVLIDATSIAIHGEAQPLPLQFRGLHAERHTQTTLRNRFDALRDRYAGPPITFSVDLLPSMNDIEAGDIVRAVFPQVRDYSGTGTLDRAFEVQRVTIDQLGGRVTAELFGSTAKAEPIVDGGAGASAELPNGWYSSEGTEMGMGTSLTIDGSGFLLANGTLTGGESTRTIYYYLGDFTVSSGVTLTLEKNVEIRILGQFQINGTVRINTGRAANTSGYLGSTYGGRGLHADTPKNGSHQPFAATVVAGRHSALPALEIENNAGVIEGIPPDMRGSGGGTGGDVLELTPPIWNPIAAGGSGGQGGGSMVVVSRGAGFGVSGEVVLSGEDGSTGAEASTVNGDLLQAGSGGGGAPGTAVFLLDGSDVTFPILAGNVVAEYGTSPIKSGNAATQGKARAADPVDLGVAAARVIYVPKSRDPYPDFTNVNFGPDGRPGLPGAGTITFYDDITTTQEANGNGRYAFLTTSADDSGTVVWASITTLSGVDYLLIHDNETGGTPDNSDFYDEIVVGDVVTWYDSARRWVEFRITSIETPPAGRHKFGIELVELDQIDGDDNIPGAAGNGIEFRWSRVPAGAQGATGATGADGRPGIPGATTILDYDDADVGGEAAGAGRYAFLLSSTDSDGSVTWSVLTTPSGVVFLLINKDDESSADRSSFLNQVSVGDIVTWYDSAQRWLEYRITSIETPPSDRFKFGISLVEFDEADGSGNIPATSGNSVEFRFSRAESGSSVHTATVYRRKSGAAPSTPTGGSYNFTTNVLTPPTDWFQSIPALDGNPLYASTGSFSVVGTGGVNTNTPTWTTPTQIDSGSASLGDVGEVGVLSIPVSGDSHAEIKVDADGDIYTKEDGGAYNSVFTYIGVGAASDFEVKMVKSSGTTPSGSAVGAWLSCGSDRSWFLDCLESASPCSKSFLGIMKFRRVSDNQLLSSEECTLSVET